MQYINDETRTWNSTEDFLKAITLLWKASGHGATPGYPLTGGGWGGDQGTRASW